MKTTKKIMLIALALLVPASVMAAAIDEKALLSSYPGSNLISEKVTEFDEYELVVGGIDSAKGTCENKQKLNGRVAVFYYENPKGRSHAEIFTNYRDAVKKAGFQTIFTCKEEGCYLDGKPSNNSAYCGDHSIGTLPSGGSRYLAAKLPRKDGDIYLAVHVYEYFTNLHYVTVKPVETGLVKVDAKALQAGIQTDGHVAVYGIEFDTGKADLKSGAAPVIAEIVKLLKGVPTLKLHVVGHTDTQGAFEENIALSRRRAESVVRELTTMHGIAAARLRPDGVGPLVPLSTNDTAEGRAKNRRVDLVKQ
jgi:outer membrane protein OmpA-like peptidoglycan-associated protein